MIVMKAFIKRGVNRNSFTTWQCLHWINVFSQLPQNVRPC